MPAISVPQLLLTDRLRNLAPVLVLIALILLVGVLRPAFFTPESLLVTIADTAILFILGAGSTFVAQSADAHFPALLTGVDAGDIPKVHGDDTL